MGGADHRPPDSRRGGQPFQQQPAAHEALAFGTGGSCSKDRAGGALVSCTSDIGLFASRNLEIIVLVLFAPSPHHVLWLHKGRLFVCFFSLDCPKPSDSTVLSTPFKKRAVQKIEDSRAWVRFLRRFRMFGEKVQRVRRKLCRLRSKLQCERVQRRFGGVCCEITSADAPTG